MAVDILTNILSSAGVMAIVVYFAKKWISFKLDQMAKSNSHELDRQLARLNIHEPHLHQRRIEVIEEIYKKMLDAEFSLQQFLISWWAHTNKEEIIKRGFPVTGELSMERGLKFTELYTEINALMYQNALYFDDRFLNDIENAYKPFFDIILQIGESGPPEFPDGFKDIVNVGQTPRASVISIFRKTLGVNHES